jgi:hypothetical protein
MQAALFLRTEAAHVSLDGDEVSLLVHEHLLEARHPRQAAVHRTHAVSCNGAELVGKFACYMWEGYRRHTGPELHTGGMRGSNGKFQKNQI